MIKQRPHRFIAVVCITFIATLLLTACGSTTKNTTKPVTPRSSALPLSSNAKTLFPSGITIVVNLPPGGPTYSQAEAIQPYLENTLGVPVTIRPIIGGGGNTAAEYVYRAKANSGTLMMAYLPQLNVGQLIGNGNYDAPKYTALAGMYGNDTSIFVSKYGSKYTNFKSLQHSSSIVTVGVFGINSSAGWMAATFLSKINHIKTATIAYKNGAAAIDGVISGAVDIASVTRAQAIPAITEHEVQGVVAFSPKRLGALPSIESIAAVGKKSEAFYNLGGVVGPPGMPSNEVLVLNRALRKVYLNSSFIAKARQLSLVPSYENAKAWAATIRSYNNLVQSHLSVLK